VLGKRPASVIRTRCIVDSSFRSIITLAEAGTANKLIRHLLTQFSVCSSLWENRRGSRMPLATFPWWDALSIQAEWELREEPVGVCAARLGRMLEALETLHPGFPLLMWTGGPMRPLYPVPAHFEELAPLFRPERIYDDVRKRRLPNGFSFRADARLDGKRSLQLHIRAGNHVECNEQLAWPNFVSISTVIYDRYGTDRPILQALKPALAAVIAAWEPERAGAFSRHLLAGKDVLPGPSFYNGAWAAYLAPGLAQTVIEWCEAVVEPLRGGGSLLLVTDGVFNDADPLQRQAGLAIRQVLTAASS
jgi:hypothetical protein